ncbi:MAG: hypothetical protein NTZ73_03125 [Candidatus Diapherotrites archaeon]|nr:hypothetical protein [Candidatus Diapherotrites archaeon]
MERKIAQIALIITMIFVLGGACYAISFEEAFNIVSVTNNLISSGESTQAVKVIDSGADYWVVIATVENSTNAYIPVKSSDGSIESGAVKTRNLIKAAIVKIGMADLRNNYSASWGFSTTTKSELNDAAKELSAMPAKVLMVKTELEKVSDNEARKLMSPADALMGSYESVAEQSNELSKRVEESMAFESEFLEKPATDQISEYQKKYEEFFTEVESLKENYENLNSKINSLKEGISPLTSIDISTKSALNSNLDMPIRARVLDSVFSASDLIKDQVNGVFSSTSKADTYYSTLQTRLKRNEAWQLMYNSDKDITKANQNFQTLDKAAESILLEENVSFWVAKDEVEQLKTSWKNAVSNYNGGRYDEAKIAAAKAKKNVLEILKQGIEEQAQEFPQELIIQAIIILAVALFGLYIFETFYLKKKKKEEGENEEEF